ncbi:MAG: M24 family metallopeptidase [Acidimicrobiales bacterium]
MSNDRDHSELPPMAVGTRLDRLRERFAAACDALLVTKLVNLRYLTGFTGSAGMLLVRERDAVFLSDGRYRDQATDELGAAGVEASIEIGRAPAQLEALDRSLKGVRRLGLEAEEISWGEKERLSEELESIGPGLASLVATRGLIEGLRAVKDDGELARIELAADIADVAFAQVKPRLKEGVTEREFGLELDWEMRRRGADEVSFETIVGSGPNGALPHARPSERVVSEGDVVVVDFGAGVDGYRSDMTRTLCVGPLQSQELAELLDAVLAAQRAGVRALRPGVAGGEVDTACRESLAEAGLGELFVHGTGHGVGLEIHEAPAVGPGSTDILAEGQVVTVEPGAYAKGTGGARIEDTLVVTASGARALTKSTKDTVL